MTKRRKKDVTKARKCGRYDTKNNRKKGSDKYRRRVEGCQRE
jgi:hypothetical protein